MNPKPEKGRLYWVRSSKWNHDWQPYVWDHPAWPGRFYSLDYGPDYDGEAEEWVAIPSAEELKAIGRAIAKIAAKLGEEILETVHFLETVRVAGEVRP